MKKMNYDGIVCDVIVDENCRFFAEVPCVYEADTIAYAVERFLARYPELCRKCTYESWQLRLAKGKARQAHPFTWVFPAPLLELPGNWVELTGRLDAHGVRIRKVRLLKSLPDSGNRVHRNFSTLTD